jgi:hypothetical protein
MNTRIAGTLFLIALVLTGCGAASNRPAAATGAIWATSVSTSVGSTNEGASQQVISYRITLKNAEPAAVIIHSIKLLFANELEKRMISDRQVTIENTIEPNASIEIDGHLTFSANGVSKTQIAGWGPLIKGITASTEQSVFLRSPGTN